jgi:hypothetical protein
MSAGLTKGSGLSEWLPVRGLGDVAMGDSAWLMLLLRGGNCVREGDETTSEGMGDICVCSGGSFAGGWP